MCASHPVVLISYQIFFQFYYFAIFNTMFQGSGEGFNARRPFLLLCYFFCDFLTELYPHFKFIWNKKIFFTFYTINFMHFIPLRYLHLSTNPPFGFWNCNLHSFLPVNKIFSIDVIHPRYIVYSKEVLSIKQRKSVALM